MVACTRDGRRSFFFVRACVRTYVCLFTTIRRYDTRILFDEINEKNGNVSVTSKSFFLLQLQPIIVSKSIHVISKGDIEIVCSSSWFTEFIVRFVTVRDIVLLPSLPSSLLSSSLSSGLSCLLSSLSIVADFRFSGV